MMTTGTEETMSNETKKAQSSTMVMDVMVSSWFVAIGVFFSVALLA